MRQRGEGQRTRRVPAWVRDAGSVIVAVVIGGLASESADVAAGVEAELDLVVGLGAAMALWWRRRAPLVVAAVTFVAAAVAPLAAGAAIVSVYTVAVLHRTRVAAIVAALYLAPGGLALALRLDGDANLGESVLGAALFTGGALGWGIAVRVRQQAADDRAALVERDHQKRIDEARQEERRQIAAEMHDALAHRLSLLSLHAAAIELRPGMRPEDLASSAGLVRRNARLALDDLHAVVGVLRDETPLTLAPSPSARDLEALLAESREVGMRIDGAVSSVDLGAMPDELGRHVYRIVQEGLTNARKHGPGMAVELRMTGAPGAGLRIEIANATSDRSAGYGMGVGLVGLRERVTAIGGTLTHDIDEAGLYRLCAQLPWSP